MTSHKDDVAQVQEALRQSEGSFSAMFKKETGKAETEVV